jgi:hypothetical protein
MPDTPPFKTLADFATALGVSEKTAKRQLERLMCDDPGIRVTRIGRALRFTPAQWDRVLKAMEWRPRIAEFVEWRRHVAHVVRRKDDDGLTAQAQVEQLTRSLLPPRKRPWPGRD